MPWSEAVKIPGQTSRAAPALAAFPVDGAPALHAVARPVGDALRFETVSKTAQPVEKGRDASAVLAVMAAA
jgi:hypothetical protein